MVEGVDRSGIPGGDGPAFAPHGRSQFVASGQPEAGNDSEALDLLDASQLGVGRVDGGLDLARTQCRQRARRVGPDLVGGG
ncbi:hypothetical protein [Hoyosella subflava]|uniref:hypothetical protein n=1 Tax=Hoyosella subflava TaxID=639313 RepID=UPI00059C200F|nr:hypothetical protein [Hoyosella subflava]